MHEYVYHDRKMMKWLPFNALLEQGNYINDLLHGRERIEMPILSPDQLAELNYNLEVAYLFHHEVAVSYYESYRIKEVVGTIARTDVHNHLIFVGETAISAHQITHIEIL